MSNLPPDIAMAMQMVGVQRENTFLKSNQISLGDFVECLRKACETATDDAHVCFDFGRCIPGAFDSYRGSYDEFALSYRDWDDYQSNVKYDDVKLKDFLAEAESCIGKQYTGYKGGEYTMSESTPLWCAGYGNSGHTYITGAQSVEDGFFVVIHTCYGEF